MLVMTRRRGEWIDIGNDVAICIVEVRGDKVRIGIEAPKDVPVHRREVTERIRDQERIEDREAGSDPDGAAGSAGASRAMSAD